MKEHSQVEMQDRGTRNKERGEARSAGNLITLADPAGAGSEDYRALRTSLLYGFVDEPPKVVVVTSPGPQEGKSTTCANLGVVLAQAGKNTLVLDCDFRRPSIHKVFGLRNLYGAVNVLGGDSEMRDVWHEPLPGLKVVTVGTIPNSPAELVGSKRFAGLVEEARREFDYVLLDAPPTGAVSDPAILATQGDGALLVLDAQKTRKRSLRKARRDLEAVGAKVLGTVMNKVKDGQGGLYSSYTY